jgi:hypothetical protein
MPEMSPLGRVLMKVLQKGSWGAGALALLFAAILIYQRTTPEGGLAFRSGDAAFLGVLAALFALAVYLVRGIARELDGKGD